MQILVQKKLDGIRGSKMSDVPTPDQVEQAGFLVEFWQHILAGTIVILTSWYISAKGKKTPIYVEESDIEQKLTICKQSILLALNEELDKRDEKLLNHIKDLMK